MDDSTHHDRKKATHAVPQQTPADDPMAGFGPNEWLVEELREAYRADPGSVAPEWREFFSDGAPGPDGDSPADAPAAHEGAPLREPAAEPVPVAAPAAAPPAAPPASPPA
ncbi:hypothetical protein ACFQL5_12770, partial [Aquipuribacter hungaricus]|uniref:2-oxoglutarate dehydrogenase E1 subunit family protein n=1 Tax=Aquipuribacter hungaricus TaxID=545624 RepID=UPI00360B54AD